MIVILSLADDNDDDDKILTIFILVDFKNALLIHHEDD